LTHAFLLCLFLATGPPAAGDDAGAYETGGRRDPFADPRLALPGEPLRVATARLDGLAVIADVPVAFLTGGDGIGHALEEGEALADGWVERVDFAAGLVLLREGTATRNHRVEKRIRQAQACTLTVESSAGSLRRHRIPSAHSRAVGGFGSVTALDRPDDREYVGATQASISCRCPPAPWRERSARSTTSRSPSPTIRGGTRSGSRRVATSGPRAGRAAGWPAVP